MSKLLLLKAYCLENNRICPNPIFWNEVYDLIVGETETTLPLPLILAAWWDTEPRQKQIRFHDHLDYAATNGTLDAVDKYLRELSDIQWFTSSEYS